MKQRQSALIIAAVILSSAASAGHHEDSKSDAAPMMGSLSTAQKIDLAKASAPSNVSDEARILDADNTVLQEGDNGWTCMVGNPRPAPEGGWPTAHDAMPVCTDDVGMKWMSDFMAGKAPEIERDTFMWMLHGDVGEDNTTAGVLNKADAKDPSQWIESGPHTGILYYRS